MFSRTNKDANASAAPHSAPRKASVASLVADGVTLRGDVASAGDMHLDGVVEGDVRVGRLTIGETGAVQGVVEAESVEIRGRVTGSISARQVRLLATARVDGDISHAELSIEAGAYFQGRSLVFAASDAPATVVELSPMAAE